MTTCVLCNPWLVLCLALGAGAAQPRPPVPVGPLPSANQLAWQDMELTAFAHFGINTFYDQEWGNGTEDPNRFYPTNFAAAQWVSILKGAGFKELILTAKHHDGFCLWPSAYTAHSVKSSAWFKAREAAAPGSGDVVKAVADACHKTGLKFGVYLSPWDRNSSYYGQGAAYNTYYENQLRELLRQTRAKMTALTKSRPTSSPLSEGM
jgi:alpha-L-fucosidase